MLMDLDNVRNTCVGSVTEAGENDYDRENLVSLSLLLFYLMKKIIFPFVKNTGQTYVNVLIISSHWVSTPKQEQKAEEKKFIS